MKSALIALTLFIAPNFALAGRYMPVYCEGSNAFNTVKIHGMYDNVEMQATDNFSISQTGSSGSRTIVFPANLIAIKKSGDRIVIRNAWVNPIAAFEISGDPESANDGQGRMTVSTSDMAIAIVGYNANCMF